MYIEEKKRFCFVRENNIVNDKEWIFLEIAILLKDKPVTC